MLEDPTTDSVPEDGPGALPACLLVYGPDRVDVIRLSAGRPVVVGRTTPATLIFPSPSLSRQHARFEKYGDEVWVEDLGSKNGTRVNGRKIDRARLVTDDQVQVGDVVVCLHAPDDDQPDPNPSLFSHDHFRTVVELEVDRARAFQRRLALILAKESGAPSEGGLRAWYPRVRKLLRSVDRLAQYGPRALEVVLAEAGREDAERVVRRMVEERHPDQPSIVCGVALFPESATSAEELIEASRRAARMATKDAPIHFAEPLDSARTPAANHDGSPIVETRAMRELFSQVDRLSRASIPVLVVGETGTGKEVVAQRLHAAGPRKDKPIRCINCAAIPTELIESVLFGHVRGAFTGAESPSKGVFEAADGGTLLLDEVGELSAAAQAALLRVLETKTFTRVGSNDEVTVDVRVVAATHRDLEAMAEEGKFRTDLLYRLNAITLRVPPLRERAEEIEALVDAFGAEAVRANESQVTRFAPEVMDALRRYVWPGNVRELRNVVEYAVVIASGDEVLLEDLPERVRGEASTDERAVPIATRMGDESHVPDFKARVRRIEESLIKRALLSTDHLRSEAAELLKIPLRTLNHKIATFEESPVPDLATPEGRERWIDEIDERVPDGDTLEFRVRFQRYEAAVIREALAAAGGNKARTSRALKMPLRTLVNKVRTYEL